MSLKDALEARELYLQHKENPLLKRGLDLKELAKPMTNGDRIRAMTDEELAKMISLHKPMYSWPDSVRRIYFGFNNHNKENPVKAWLEWLQQPVKGER